MPPDQRLPGPATPPCGRARPAVRRPPCPLGGPATVLRLPAARSRPRSLIPIPIPDPDHRMRPIPDPRQHPPVPPSPDPRSPDPRPPTPDAATQHRPTAPPTSPDPPASIAGSWAGRYGSDKSYCRPALSFCWNGWCGRSLIRKRPRSLSGALFRPAGLGPLGCTRGTFRPATRHGGGPTICVADREGGPSRARQVRHKPSHVTRCSQMSGKPQTRPRISRLTAAAGSRATKRKVLSL